MSKCNFLEMKYVGWIGKKEIGKAIIQKKKKKEQKNPGIAD